jgi:hypothetical protein
MLNPILERNIFKEVLCPEAKEAKYMVNVEVGLPSGNHIRWYVGIYYKFEKGEWIEESDLKKLSTYQGKQITNDV